MMASSFSRAFLRPAVRLQGVATEMLASSSSACTTSRRSMVSATNVLLEQRTMKLPGLGDSITEGTIVEWTVSVGQAVKEGDVVAMVETDKVTVDIKAETDGVVIEQFVAVDDTAEVGADLYKIDTDAEATVSAAAPSSETPAAGSAPSEPAAPKAAATPPKPVAAAAASSSRSPSIQFLGKTGWEKRRAGVQTPSLVYIPPSYGRPTFTEEEMEALVTGGASMAPQVKQLSSGALFG